MLLRLPRLLKGDFWVNAKRPTCEGFLSKGNPEAVTKDHPEWRNLWEWIVFRPEIVPTGCYIFFYDEKTCMRYFRKIPTLFVAVRVGPGDATFVATRSTSGRDEVELTKIYGPASKESIRRDIKFQGFRNEITFI